ncbi:MAG: PaaI family thioesterase [Pseudomonadota bacterium]
MAAVVPMPAGSLPRGAPIGEGRLMTGLPFSAELGMRLHGAADGVALLSVGYDQRLVGDPATGVMHGGVITALLDTACGSCVMARRQAGGAPPGGDTRAQPRPLPRVLSTATLDLRIDYMRPARPGIRILARAECYRQTRAIAFVRAVAYHDIAPGADESDADTADLVASASGAFILERAPSGDGQDAS